MATKFYLLAVAALVISSNAHTLIAPRDLNLMQKEVRLASDVLFGESQEKGVLDLLTADGTSSSQRNQRLRSLAQEILADDGDSKADVKPHDAAEAAKAAPAEAKKAVPAAHKQSLRHTKAAALPFGVGAGKGIGAEIAGLEEVLTSLMLSKGGASETPLAEQTDKIKYIIENDMLPKIQNASDDDQFNLNNASQNILTCATVKNDATTAAEVEEGVYTTKSPEHKACRVTESELLTELTDAQETRDNKEVIKNERCEAFATLSAQMANDELQKESITKALGEDDETYVRRVHSTFCDPSDLDEFLESQTACNDATTEYDNWVTQVNDLQTEYDNKKVLCTNLQKEMDDAACSHASQMKDACEVYAECHITKSEEYATLKATVEANEADRVNEWRATKRMACIIDAFEDGAISDDEINTCKDKTHDTDNLVIDYPDETAHAESSCVIPDLYPASSAYKLAEYSGLPATAPADEEANICLAIETVSTTPAEGSPDTCACERVTLTGTYSAGALVKCTGCTDISRSTDDSSCPQGTKLFSPASRTDWDTFFASTSPVAEPDFIVDVTRPADGNQDGSDMWVVCGNTASDGSWGAVKGSECNNRDAITGSITNDYGNYMGVTCCNDAGTGTRPDCVKSVTYEGAVSHCESHGLRLCTYDEIHAGSGRGSGCSFDAYHVWTSTPCTESHPAMKSDNAEQNTWVTSDGSDWWLSDVAFSQPDGGYTANCYLGLSTAMSDGNMEFDDADCGKHSTSYFCQPNAINLTPKDGSPDGCLCEEVTLTGEYSPGYLLKCTGCLDVYKSNDANSCPDGTKIFSPRSREDWQTIFDSGGPLRSPHWIIDITRESSGGSYTSYVMNSDVSEVAAWKTEDGSSWWLRSTTYSEPNGDYTADCYLDLWHASQDNADNVQWNDGSCSYHATDYYCQPTA